MKYIMNDSLELRKRILKMREVNNIVPKSLELLNLNNHDSDLIQPKKDNILLTNLNVIKKPKIIKNKSEVYNHTKKFDLVLNSKKQSEINYDSQFILLANKFNEVVEVILELSDRLENLEKSISLQDKKTKKIIKYSQFPGLKFIIFIVLTSFFALGIIYLPFNFIMLKTILSDISFLI